MEVHVPAHIQGQRLYTKNANNVKLMCLFLNINV